MSWNVAPSLDGAFSVARPLGRIFAARPRVEASLAGFDFIRVSCVLPELVGAIGLDDRKEPA